MSSIYVPSGWLRHKVRVYHAVETPDGQGGSSKAWAFSANAPAKVEELKGRERMFGNSEHAVADYRITIRWRGDLSSDDRLKFNGRMLRIVAPLVNPEARNLIQTVYCVAVDQ